MRSKLIYILFLATSFMPSSIIGCTSDAGNDITLCYNYDSFDLAGIPAGGIWSGPGVSHNKIYPKSLNPGVYKLYYTITDSVCSSTDSTEITITAGTYVNTGSDRILCKNIIEVILTQYLAVNPQDGVWSGPGVVNGIVLNNSQLDTGIFYQYIYTVTRLGCSSRDTILLKFISLTASFKAEFIPGKNPPEVQFKNNSRGAYTYSWEFGDTASGSNDTSTMFEPIHTYNQNGTYTVKLTASNPEGCMESYQMVLPVVAEGIRNSSSSPGFEIYPNPTTGQITVKGGANQFYSVKNALGNELITGTLNGNKIMLNMVDMPAGIYFIEVDGMVKTIIRGY
jgi:PKD repeat protein